MNLFRPFIVVLLLFFVNDVTYAQIRLKYFPEDDREIDVRNSQVVSVPSNTTELNTIKVQSALQTGHQLKFSVNGETKDLTSTTATNITFAGNILGKTIAVKHFKPDGSELTADAITFQVNADGPVERQDLNIEVEISDGENSSELVKIVDKQDVIVSADAKDFKTLTLTCSNLPAKHTLKVSSSNETLEIKNNKKTTLTFKEGLLDKEISIRHFDDANKEITENLTRFHIVREDKDGDEDDAANTVSAGINEYLSRYANFTPTPFGYIDPSEKEPIVHIFFDHFGNSLLSTVPQGISNAQYKIHIIYPFKTGQDLNLSYSVKQKTGSFSSALMFNNTNIRSQVAGGLLQSTRASDYDGITERTFLLGTASDDLAFDILLAEKGKAQKAVLESYTIKMTPVYHGSFDVGLLRTDLSNPEYSLVDLPGATNGEQVVKQTDEAPRGVVTIMVSFYTSPVIWLRSLISRTKLGKKQIPFYKLTGRNFLDDHKLYERIYPAIGVSVSDKAFENLFFGFNWELARGLSVFGGWHYGKVNTFTKPEFVPLQTVVTPAEFEFYQTTQWKTSGAIGVKLDAMILRNLFGG